MRNKPLDWPLETAAPDNGDWSEWHHAGSNLCLDFHGDPLRARLTVFSDGNHHMALRESLQVFLELNPDARDVFYATTPPGVLVEAMRRKGLRLGNLNLSARPQVFIGPDDVIAGLERQGFTRQRMAFMRSRGNVLLIHKQNPKAIGALNDLLRDDVRLAISNPQSEKASFEVYRATLQALAENAGMDDVFAAQSGRMVYSQRIHHREIPQLIADGYADVAPVYYHLALRYTRIFPDLFDFIPLGGSHEQPAPAAGNRLTEYQAALLQDADSYGEALYEFLAGERVSAIYAAHGLMR